MKIYNSPEQAHNLRDIEAAAAASEINMLINIHGTDQSACTSEEEQEEREETQTEETSQKARKKKNQEKI